MEEVKRGRGRPVGAKDSKPRKTEARALAALSDLANAGYGPANVAKQNLEMIDFLVEKKHREIQVLSGDVLNQDSIDLKHNDKLEYLRRVQQLDDQLMKLIAQRQKWVADVAKYTDYTKGSEKVVQDSTGEVTTVGDLLSMKKAGPLLEG